MNHEAEARSAEVRHSEGNSEGGGGAESPLQTRATFLQNWDWQSVVGLNRGLCERGGAQHGENSESHAAVAKQWTEKQGSELTLEETLDYLRACHRTAPFLFFNGNTFAEIGRVLCDYIFADLPLNRKKTLRSAIAHYIAGVLDRQSSFALVLSMCRAASFKPGDRVTTLRGSSRGVITRVLEDGRIAWKSDAGGLELITLPENLVPEGSGHD